jgi:transglutaminase-like putative cysteine protease
MQIVFRVLILSFLVINSVFARFATKEDSCIEYEIFNRDVTVSADGTYEEIVEQQIALLNERGRDYYGTYAEYYNKNAEKFKIIEAYTIFNGKKIPVLSKMIEDKPVANSMQGFDSIHRVLISYQKAEVGAKLYLKYRTKVFKIPLKGFFHTHGYWGLYGYWRSGNLKIASKIPFHFLVNDPYDSLKINHKEEKGTYILTANLKKPLCIDLVNEENAILSDEKKTWVKISNLDKHEDFAAKMAPKYEEVVYSKLPDAYAKIVEEARKLVEETDQINHITSKLNEIVRYMGDWRTIDGGLFPRKLDEVVKTGFGDCKDFASSTAAMLHNLGYKARVALVYRGEGRANPKKFLPSFSLQNHAISHAISPSGKEYFLDPTNGHKSMAEGIFPDIAGKLTYILDSQNPRMSQIPDIDYKHAKIHANSVISAKNGYLEVSGTNNVFGEIAYYISGAGLIVSKQLIEEDLINQISGDVSCIEKKIQIPDFTSRIVRDYNVIYSYKKLDDRMRTPSGSVFAVRMPTGIKSAANDIMNITDDREGDLYLGFPVSYICKDEYQNANVVNLKMLNFKHHLPHGSFERKAYAKGTSVIVEHKLELIRGYIYNEELKMPEFKKFRDNLKREFSVGVIGK